jgi:hypothetical protein
MGEVEVAWCRVGGRERELEGRAVWWSRWLRWSDGSTRFTIRDSRGIMSDGDK